MFEEQDQEQVILNLAYHRSTAVSTEEELSDDAPSVNTDSKEASKEEMQAKLMTAKMHAIKETQQYKELVDNFAEGLDKLCLFRGTGAEVKSFCYNILDNIVDPILKGTKPAGMTDSMFRDYRVDMFKTLINRYVNKVGADTENE
jgi:hypothetical protein